MTIVIFPSEYCKVNFLFAICGKTRVMGESSIVLMLYNVMVELNVSQPPSKTCVLSSYFRGIVITIDHQCFILVLASGEEQAVERSHEFESCSRGAQTSILCSKSGKGIVGSLRDNDPRHLIHVLLLTNTFFYTCRCIGVQYKWV